MPVKPVILDASCRLCPRLAAFLDLSRAKNPDWHNAPVNGFGPTGASLAIVGLAPGMRGANRTGRPFTGDFAGDLLFQMLAEFGLSTGVYKADADDGLQLTGVRIFNAVRCLPPQNKPTGGEVNTCRQFLTQDLTAMPHLKTIITLGRIGHTSCLKALDLKEKDYPFGHNARHILPDGILPNGGRLISSYHCSRYNTQTRRLTTAMFRDVFISATAN
ncbi:MAG: uracil-DNA glycosylase [Candidatus Puniceispirillales bacterium WSBS_2018_MAG_OTU23]